MLTADHGQRLRLTCSRDELLSRLQIVGRAVSTRSSVQILSGILFDAGDGERPPLLAATDMELSVRAPLDAEVVGGRPRGAARPPPARHRAAAAGRPGVDRARRGWRARDDRGRRQRVQAAHLRRRRLPRAARDRPRAALHRRARGLPRGDRARRPRRVPRRGAPGPHGRAPRARPRHADRRRDRLLSAGRAHDDARGRPGRGHPGDRAGPRARRARPHRAGLDAPPASRSSPSGTRCCSASTTCGSRPA